MSANQIEEIKAKIDIVELIQEYLPLKRAGRNYKGLCPFHGEKSPSFMVNPELQIFRCFGCSEGGDVYEFVQKMEGLEFGETLRLLAKRVGVTLTGYQLSKGEETKDRLLLACELAGNYYHFLLTKHKLGEPGLAYLKGRGITDEVIETFKLGFAPEGWDFLMKYLVGKKSFSVQELEKAGLLVNEKYDRFRNRVMFSLNNHRGQTVGFAGRVMPGADEKAGGKYINTPETEIYHKGELLYGLDINKTVIKKAGFVVVVEGEIDAIASWMAGVKNVVAIKGSALTEKQVELIRRYAETVVLGLDADMAGDAAMRRGIDVAHKAGLIIKVINAESLLVNPKKYKDPGEWAIADPVGWKKAVEASIPIYDFYIESAVNRYGLDGLGKQKIGRELTPIWAKIEDDILRAHYIKRLATVLEVGEDDVKGQINKIANPSKTGDTSLNKIGVFRAEKPVEDINGEIREKRLIQLAILGNKITELTSEPIRDWIRNDYWKKVVNFATENAAGATGVQLVKMLPAELRDGVSNLFLVEVEFEDKDWDEAKKLMELTVIEDKLKSEKDVAVVRNLARRKGELTSGR